MADEDFEPYEPTKPGEILQEEKTAILTRVKRFGVKYQLPLAVGATAVVSLAVSRKVLGPNLSSHVDYLSTTLAAVEAAFDDTAGALGTAMDFIEHKNLNKQFATFVEKQVTA